MPRNAAVPAEPSSSPPLLGSLLRLLAAHRPAFRQERTFRRMQALLLGCLFSFARRTVTQALVTLGLTDHDWSAFYRLFNEPRLDYEVLTGCFFRKTLEHLPEERPCVAVVDGVQVPRHSHKMPGTSWLKHPKTPPFMPGPHRAQRFLHLAALLPRSAEGYTRALPLRWEPAFPEKAVLPDGTDPRKQWEPAVLAVRWLRARLDEAGRASQRLLVLGDGDFSVAKMRALLPEGVVLMTRFARNRILRELPVPETVVRRGRPRFYGPRARKPHEWLGERSGWRRARLRVRGRTVSPRYRVEGPFLLERAPGRPVFLVVVKGVQRASGRGRRARRDPAFWIVSAVRDCEGWRLPFSAAELLSWAWQRWEVEVSHREMKTGFGLGEIQCWSKEAAVLAVQWQAWAYGVLVLAGYRAWGMGLGPIRPPGRWWNGSGRWSLGSLWRGYHYELWGTEEFRPIFAATGDGWPEKEALLAGMGNAVNGSLRG
ncbi:hypothetical protein GBA63_08305 [Rubrobacter tropicus]|uniref:Transposase IS701-like DDE domain-containing protein n=1 Tax=Rubrobacter tropicus TaxID=2653851 RepID=A0A6G8Q870_9ACTN|nr:transposase [Rubrobacter tropicus]QIN82643.1 hypothetical protein GBA63_08305 [Rubrobacter tropicus]